MCRILCVRAAEPFALSAHLAPFAAIAEHSREYQGHGWGCSWLSDGHWQHYHDIRPIWEDPKPPEDETTLLVAHARSAFRDEGIAVENNMPFVNTGHSEDGGGEERVFVFNGELRGVRIKAQGRIGAEKIFNYVTRFDRGDLGAAVERGAAIIDKRTRYVRAMNFIIATAQRLHVCSWFGEDPAYFQLQMHQGADALIICSERYGEHRDWRAIDNRTTLSL